MWQYAASTPGSAAAPPAAALEFPGWLDMTPDMTRAAIDAHAKSARRSMARARAAAAARSGGGGARARTRGEGLDGEMPSPYSLTVRNLICVWVFTCVACSGD